MDNISSKNDFFGSRSSSKMFQHFDIYWMVFLSLTLPLYMAKRTMALISHTFNSLNILLYYTKLLSLYIVRNPWASCWIMFKMLACSSRKRLIRIWEIVSTFLDRWSCTKRELVSLLDYLNFACKVIHLLLDLHVYCWIMLNGTRVVVLLLMIG